MNHKAATSEGPLRMQFELSRDDDPSLYDDMVRFKKGTKRINRLRFLAHEGMVAQTLAQGGVASRGSAAFALAAGNHGLDEIAPSGNVTASMFDGGVVDE
ncbi:hypothetical protein [Sphaerotilus sp.]|uniref:hypothetical protein n=1 Tax=Sphaerotilus sp. TaxID=2093942 RepID=UPI002ACDBADB|nr:hypothetical protein [Sphaerotilus sp.]MDZ7855742.1 hypothetical protein [Sphaerotilus sp.]